MNQCQNLRIQHLFVVERIHLVKIGISGHVDMYLPLGPRGRDLQRTAG